MHLGDLTIVKYTGPRPATPRSMMNTLTQRMRDWLAPAPSADPVRISGERAQGLVDAGARLIDVRTVDEYSSGRVTGSVNIPVHELAARLGELGPKDEPVVLYCRSGARSGRGARMLRELGYAYAYDMGPITVWPRRG